MRLIRSAPLHMALIGTVLFTAARFWPRDLFAERPRVVIPQHRLTAMRKVFLEENGRPPTRDEDTVLFDALVDQEVLYRYALALGMQREPAAQERLAQIAAFVDDNPHETRSESQLANEAIRLGLHEGDLVVRRILADSARRLIRAVVLTRRPNPASVQEYLQANRELFMRPERIRITHVDADGFKWPDSEQHARELLQRIQQESLSPQAAPAVGDEPFVASALPLLTYKDLRTRFGSTFERALHDAPVGAWYGPVPSRFGHHLVWVQERQPAYLPPFGEIRARVEQRFLQKVADEWLAFRLQQLRAEFDITVPERTS
jgi:PPIC-type PPIASE domain